MMKISETEMNEQEKEHMKELHKEAEQYDSLDAKFKLGLIYSRKEKHNNINITNALRFLRKAAELKHAGAQYHYGLIFYEGREAKGLSKNFNKALCYFERAEKQGHACSQFVLGMMHEKGEIKKDGQDASYWYHKAAEHGCVSALSKLGSMCRTKDKCKAFIWFYIAKENKQEGLEEVLKQLSKEIEEEKEEPPEKIKLIESEIIRLRKEIKEYKKTELNNSLCAVCCKS